MAWNHHPSRHFSSPRCHWAPWEASRLARPSCVHPTFSCKGTCKDTPEPHYPSHDFKKGSEGKILLQMFKGGACMAHISMFIHFPHMSTTYFYLESKSPLWSFLLGHHQWQRPSTRSSTWRGAKPRQQRVPGWPTPIRNLRSIKWQSWARRQKYLDWKQPIQQTGPPTAQSWRGKQKHN